MNLGRSLKGDSWKSLSSFFLWRAARFAAAKEDTRWFPSSVRLGSARQRKVPARGWMPGGQDESVTVYSGNERPSSRILFHFFCFFFFFCFSTERSRGQTFCEHTRYVAAALRLETPDMRLIVRQVPLSEFQRLICQAILFRPNTHTLSLSLYLSFL